MTNAERILAKCGMTAEQVRAAAAKCSRPAGESLADYNERVYGEKPDPAVYKDKYGETITERYGMIASSRANGTCSTRAGTYRRYRHEDKASRGVMR